MRLLICYMIVADFSRCWIISLFCLVCVKGQRITKFVKEGSTRSTKHYDPHYGYKQYWPGGDWVLYPSTKSTIKPSSTKKGSKTQSTIRTTTIPDVCGEPCNPLLRNIGKICVQQVSTTEHVTFCPDPFCRNVKPDNYDPSFKDDMFESYCAYMAYECKNPTERYMFVNVGPCLKQDIYTRYSPNVTNDDPSSVVNRSINYIKEMNERFKKQRITITY